MKTTELAAGVRTTWALDKVDVLTVVIYAGIYIACMVMLGGPWTLTVGMLVLAASVLAFKVYQRARDHREALLFFEWMNEQTSAE